MAGGKAVILLSGGADSATALAVAGRDGFELYALTLDYGQRHRIELEAARKIAENFHVKKHLTLEVDLKPIGSSALTDEMEIPMGRSMEEISTGIPVTYVPARNTIFLSLALGWAESLGTGDIFIGVNALDYSGYPDCRPEYIKSFEQTARLATKIGVEEKKKITIHAPLINLAKAQIFKLGHELGVDFSITHSCYAPNLDGRPCGKCDSCILRLHGFVRAGLKDPLEYPAKNV
ncbi:MAG: 7-cyano-7-deazaguanine synthase [bacterium]|nr:MAG: 7-cyano-7-deazaguanine synthase [bacterium]